MLPLSPPAGTLLALHPGVAFRDAGLDHRPDDEHVHDGHRDEQKVLRAIVYGRRVISSTYSGDFSHRLSEIVGRQAFVAKESYRVRSREKEREREQR